MKTTTRHTANTIRLSDAQSILRRHGYYSVADEIHRLHGAYNATVKELDAKASQAVKAAEEGKAAAVALGNMYAGLIEGGMPEKRASGMITHLLVSMAAKGLK